MKTILIADDEKTFLLSLSEGLRFCDPKFNVITVENGLQAMDVLKSCRTDLLITDLMMPMLDGMSLVSLSSRRYPDLPIIVLTAHLTQEMATKLRSMGVTASFEKPVDLSDVTGAVAAILNSSSSCAKYGSGLSAISSAFTYLLSRENA